MQSNNLKRKWETLPILCPDTWALVNWNNAHLADIPKKFLKISHQSQDSVVKCWQSGACKDGEGWNKWICGQRAGDRVRSTWQIHFSQSPVIYPVAVASIWGSGLAWWPRGEWWVWSICLGSNTAAAMALLGCLGGTNAFITVVPPGWATIQNFFIFYLFWRHQKNKYDVTGLAEQELNHILLTPSLVSWPQDSFVRWHPKNLFYLIYSSRDFWIYNIYLPKINLQKIEFDKFFTTSPRAWSFLNQLCPAFCIVSYCLW